MVHSISSEKKEERERERREGVRRNEEDSRGRRRIGGNRKGFTLTVKQSVTFGSLLSYSSFSAGKKKVLSVLWNIALTENQLVCALQKNIFKGKQIHTYLVVNGFLKYPYSITSLINMYSKCNHLDYALSVFYEAVNFNVFIWNAIISGLVTNGLARDAIQLFHEMRQESVSPDEFTYPCVFRACSDFSDLHEGKKIHAESIKFVSESNLFVASSLINFYLKFNITDAARRLFDELLDRDVVLWNSMVNGYAQLGEFNKALELFQEMMVEGLIPSKFTVSGVLSVFATTKELMNGQKVHGFIEKAGYRSDVVVSNALIDMYGKCNMIDDSRKIFETMDARDIFSWNSIISVHEQSGDHDGTLRLFDRMRCAGILPDPFTISAALPACSHLAALVHGREIHGYMIVNGLRGVGNGDVYGENAIMDMYVKCGSLRDARLVFDRMEETDSASWNIMIKGYGLHGYGNEALELFACMCKTQLNPDEVTFVGLLSACSHAGLVDEGKKLLYCMEQDYGVVPTVEHYACGVDMLGRAGLLDEAFRLAITVPTKPSPVVWRALLAACWIYSDAVLAVLAAKVLFKIDPEHCGSYVLLSNFYGTLGQHEDVIQIRQAMVHQNVRKAPGCSWVELNRGVHAFVTGDRSHPESDQIYAKLNALIRQLHECGYGPNTSPYPEEDNPV
ncbi:pentatricopeptide repeat-containing protein At3g14730-like isoform X2 [Aristolochia californica]|uniref:pentatricopeptide repeat-containing protein At3g14730-like isoform X2 n=1 Tax=Aristolochia californica TaxID=171875 RepID=UPI0035D54181